MKLSSKNVCICTTCCTSIAIIDSSFMDHNKIEIVCSRFSFSSFFFLMNDEFIFGFYLIPHDRDLVRMASMILKATSGNFGLI